MMAAVAAKVQAEIVPYIGGCDGPRKLKINHTKVSDAFKFNFHEDEKAQYQPDYIGRGLQCWAGPFQGRGQQEEEGSAARVECTVAESKHLATATDAALAALSPLSRNASVPFSSVESPPSRQLKHFPIVISAKGGYESINECHPPRMMIIRSWRLGLRWRRVPQTFGSTHT